MATVDWQNVFVPRDEHMAFLHDAFQAAQRGAPQLAVFTGETGLGKTRLVQEFYRQLSRDYDPSSSGAPEGYWPDAFDEKHRSLDVNPVFAGHPHAGKGPIPWLWWGLRWFNPETRNTGAEGLSAYQEYLEPHLAAVTARRNLGANRRGAGADTLKMLAALGLDAVTLGTASTLGDWLATLWKRRGAEQTLRDHDRQPLPAVQAGMQAALEDRLAASFALLLDTAVRNVPTVPVVLFLDDAQWADPASLRFVVRLFKAAQSGGWPLLVVATHWEQEWEQDLALNPPADGQPVRFADVPRLQGFDAAACCRDVEILPDLGPVVDAALPGLSASQRALVLGKAGGNPQLLHEILWYLRQHAAYFAGGNLARALKPEQETALAVRVFHLETLVDERFQALAEPVKRALAWSSAQGGGFLHALTAAAGRQMVPPFNPQELRRAVAAGATPASLLALAPDEPSFTRGSFRQDVYQRTAAKHLLDTGEAEPFRRGLRETLTAWTLDGTAEQLPAAERTEFLALVSRELRPDLDDRAAQAWGQAVVAQMTAFQAQYLWPKALDAAQALVDARLAGWPARLLRWHRQVEALRLLRSQRDLVRAKRLAQPLVDELLAAAKPGRDASILCDELGNVQLLEGDRRGALDSYRRGLEVSERLLREFGETPEALRDLSVSLNKVGDVQLLEGDRRGALDSYRRGLEVSERLLREFGETPEALRDLSVSCDRVGDVQLLEGDRRGALDSYRRGLEVRERLLREFGETPEALRDLSVSLNKVGDVQLLEGDRRGALDSYRRGLEVRERLLREFGETPEALRDLSVSLNKVGDVQLLEGDRRGALDSYRRGLEVRERLLREFGETPQSVRDRAVSNFKLAVTLMENEPQEAKRYFLLALGDYDRLRERGWETPPLAAERQQLEALIAGL